MERKASVELDMRRRKLTVRGSSQSGGPDAGLQTVSLEGALKLHRFSSSLRFSLLLFIDLQRICSI